MKLDKNGCSTCQAGQEHFEIFQSRIGRRTLTIYQYDYRTADGKLYSCCALSLEKCRAKRDKWVQNKRLKTKKENNK